MEIRVQVEGRGTFIVDASKVDELITWLTLNTVHVNTGPIREVVNNQITGRELLNG